MISFFGETMTAQHRHELAWLQEKRAAAARTVKQFAEPAQDKQEIGHFSLADISVADLEKEKKHEILNCPTTIVCASSSALGTNVSLFQKYFSALVSPDTFYNALHYKYVQDILFVYISKGIEADCPLHIVRDNGAFFHLVIVAEQRSKLTIIQEESGSLFGYTSTVVEAHIGEGACVTYVTLQEYGQKTQHYASKQATVKKDGRMDWIEAHFGGSYTRATATATLQEDGSSSTNTTVFLGEETQKFDIISRTIQIGKHTFADMNTVGVVADYAKSMCRGLIKITPSSFGSCGNQKIKTLLMNKHAQANAVPSMEIDNFDVRATHESSVGQINKDKLFYLMSRGFDEEHATMKIVEGYFAQLARLIPHQHIEQKVMARIRKKLHMDTSQEELLFEHYEKSEGDVYV